MDPGDLLSFLDGPGDLATPPSSGTGIMIRPEMIADDANSQMKRILRCGIGDGEAGRALLSGRPPLSLRLSAQTIS